MLSDLPGRRILTYYNESSGPVVKALRAFPAALRPFERLAARGGWAVAAGTRIAPARLTPAVLRVPRGFDPDGRLGERLQ